MSDLVILYGDRRWESPYVFSIFVALREKAVPFEVRSLDLARGEAHMAPFAELSLTERVPCIEHRGLAFSESLAIIEYLDEVFAGPSQPRLLPTAVLPRARARQLLGWLRSDLLPLREERPTSTMFYERASAKLSPSAQAAADKLLRIAERVIPEGDGELFGAWSIADADLALMLHRLILNGDAVPERARRYAIRQWQRSSVRAYLEQQRPARSS
jgi:glutathione S-transferase